MADGQGPEAGEGGPATVLVPCDINKGGAKASFSGKNKAKKRANLYHKSCKKQFQLKLSANIRIRFSDFRDIVSLNIYSAIIGVI
jgi:hypothetical protein